MINNKNNLEKFIEKVLVCSTSHIKETDIKELDYLSSISLGVYNLDEIGWLINTNFLLSLGQTNLSEEYTFNCSQELWCLIKKTKEVSCDWLLLDRDAFNLPEFPIFNW